MGNKKSKEGCLHCGNDDEGITADKRGAKVPEIEEIIKKMTDNYKREKIDIEDFLAYFDADYKFLHKAFAFACSQGKAGHESFADLEGLRRLFQLIFLEQSQYTYPDLKKYDLQPIELFAAIYLNIGGSDIKHHEITYAQCCEVMSAVIEVISCTETTNEIRKGVSGMFEEGKSITCAQLLSTYRDNFEHGRYALREAFQSLCTQKECNLPVFDMGTANILNQNILALVRMSNNKVSQAKSLYPLFNSLKSGSSFNRLAFSLIGYTAPSFLLIRHSYNTIDGKTSKGIIGAFVNSPWKDELGYQGDNTTYLFTLLPRIKFLYSYKGNGDNNFLYLNTKKITNSKYKVGLGFGGVEFKECRLWIDDEMLDKSYSLPMDGTYPSGALSDGYEEKLTIECIEAWGLGGEEDVSKQEAYRQMRHTMIHNSRKIDKKKFLEGEFANQAFEKTFGHRDNVEGDLENMKQEAGMKK